jgi:hypothetical protein
MNKPTGWWTTHPTILNLSVPGAWDSNGDGVGDFEGIRRHLDYLIDMGISGIRCQQVTRFDDDFGWSGLVAQDWFDVDPLYGTMEDFDRLMADCAKKDFKIVVMAVPEYVGWHHPDYLAAKKAHHEGLGDPRTEWFLWEDDGTVTTVWNHPAPDLANRAFREAYLKHVGFWMDKGIAGWDVDAAQSWLNLSVESVRELTDYVKARGGFITAECLTLEHEIIRQGGFNAGTGKTRAEFYNETKAIVDHNAECIRQGLTRRKELIDHGMFPYQQFGDGMYRRYSGLNCCHKLPMFRLQVAFNAALPDQVWALANSIAFPNRKITPELPKLNTICWGHLDLKDIERQEGDPDSAWNFFRRVFRLRSKEKALAIGEIEEIPTSNEQEIFAALRTSDDGAERAVTVFNFAEAIRDVTVHLDGLGIKALKNYLSGEVVSPDESGKLDLRLGYYGFKLYKVVE